MADPNVPLGPAPGNGAQPPSPPAPPHPPLRLHRRRHLRHLRLAPDRWAKNHQGISHQTATTHL